MHGGPWSISKLSAHRRIGLTEHSQTPERCPDVPWIDTYNDVITTCFLYHVCYEFRRDRGAALVLLILSCIWEKRDDSRYAFSTCNLAGMDHDTKFHEGCVDCSASSIDNVHIVLANALCDADARLANAALGYISFRKR